MSVICAFCEIELETVVFNANMLIFCPSNHEITDFSVSDRFYHYTGERKLIKADFD